MSLDNIDTSKLNESELRALQLFNKDAIEAREKYASMTVPQLVAHLAVLTIHITVLKQVIDEKGSNQPK